MNKQLVPVIDIGPFLDGDQGAGSTIARQLDEALQTIGFFTVVGHGVEEILIQQARDLAFGFFNQSGSEKMKVANSLEHMSRGYNWMGNRSLAYTLGDETPPDLQEGFAFGPFKFEDDAYHQTLTAQNFFAPNIWPQWPHDFRSTFENYYNSMVSLAEKIMELFALGLGIPENYFADKIDKHTSVIRAIHYPTQSETPSLGQLRAGEHTDYGTLTILYGDDLPGGLQIKTRNGDWVDIHPTHGALVCNVGDLMSRWTNDRWVSNLHRVVNPPADYSGPGRISIPFFHNTNYDALIQCVPSCVDDLAGPKYPPVLFSDHYLEKQTRAERKENLFDRKPSQ